MTLVSSFQLRTFYGSMITSSGADEKHKILLYYLIHSNGVTSLLLLIHLLHCLSQMQEYSFTFLMHACKWELPLLWNWLQVCLDQ